MYVSKLLRDRWTDLLHFGGKERCYIRPTPYLLFMTLVGGEPGKGVGDRSCLRMAGWEDFLHFKHYDLDLRGDLDP